MVAFFTDIADYKPCVRLPSSTCVPGRSRPLATASPRAGNPSAPCCGRAPEPSAAVSSTTDHLDATPQSAESLAPPGGNHKANTRTIKFLLCATKWWAALIGTTIQIEDGRNMRKVTDCRYNTNSNTVYILLKM